MASEQIVLFDLASRPPRSTWSLNPWKTRLLLNYKGLNYRTEWLEYPEIQPRLQGHVKPNPPPATPYTIPTILLPDGTYIMDSLSILDEINTRYPDPPLPVQNRYFDWFTLHYAELMSRFKGIYLPTIPREVLSEKSIPYWNETRTKANGMDLETLEKERGGEKGWELVGGLLREVTGMLGEEEGPFFEGGNVGYVDFWWGGFLLFCKRMGDEVWERLLRECSQVEGPEGGERHVRLLEGLERWSGRCDY